MTRRVRSLFAVCVFVALTGSVAHAQDRGEAADLAIRELGVDVDRVPPLTKEQTNYAKDIGQELVCLCGTCPRHTITDCACGWAQQNKRALEAALVAGKTKEQIIAAYEKVYGLKVRPTPPDEGVGKLSYMFPFAMIIVALGLVFFVGIRAKKRNDKAGAMTAAAAIPEDALAEQADSETRSILEKELDELDR